MTTITIAKAMMPVVSPETETLVGRGVGVAVDSFLTACLAMAAGAAEAARAVSKACKTPARNMPPIRRMVRRMSMRGMWTGFMFGPSITETCFYAGAQADQMQTKTPLAKGCFPGGEGGIRTREPCGLHAFQACALSQLRDLSFWAGRIIPENLRYVLQTAHPGRIVSHWLAYHFHWFCHSTVRSFFCGRGRYHGPAASPTGWHPGRGSRG